jgi:septal ring factor EnvC (AmiA/AmiB activator)
MLFVIALANGTTESEQISQLQDKISAQDQALVTEKQISSDLRNQIKVIEPLQGTVMQDLLNSMESLRTLTSTNAVDQSQQIELFGSVGSRSAVDLSS